MLADRISAGFAQGFSVMSEKAQVLYEATDFYAPEHERTLIWNDPDLKIRWELNADPIVSAKDRAVSFFVMLKLSNGLREKQDRTLFVPQSLDGIQARGAKGRYHPADQPYCAEDESGCDQGARGNQQANVAGLSVFCERAV
jgi:hypothetical protein